MSTKKESIEWVSVQDIVLGTNPRTTKPGKERINEYARSIALYGILVPLIADKREGAYHLQAGYTRLAALEQLKGDKALSALATMNNVDLERVPVRIYQGDEKGRLMLPIIENNFHDVMNEVDVARQVKQLLEAGQEAKSLEELPATVRSYLDRIAAWTDCPVILASVGPRRDQTIVLKKPFA